MLTCPQTDVWKAVNWPNFAAAWCLSGEISQLLVADLVFVDYTHTYLLGYATSALLGC